jgi:hypothetical protein
MGVPWLKLMWVAVDFFFMFYMSGVSGFFLGSAVPVTLW